MLLTILLSVIMMAGLFLMLLGGVGYIQDRRYFSSAPKEVLESVPTSKPERFPGQRAVGWGMIALSLALMVGAPVIGALDGIRNGFSFGQFFRRFATMLLGLKAFDIGFFDWFLLCNAGLNFFPRFYPETKAVLGRHLFGYNWKTHLAHIVAAFPVSALLAWICALVSGK